MIAACGHSPASSVDGPTGGDDDDASAGDDAGPVSICGSDKWCVEAAPAGTPFLHGVFAISAGNVLAVGDGGAIIHRDANAWTAMTSTTTQNLHGVWAASASDAWAVGAAATLVHFDGTSWSVVDVAALQGADLSAVWGSRGSDVWAVGEQTAAHYDGMTWTKTTVIGDHNGVSGTSPTDVWIVGENEKPQHFDGSWHVVDANVGTIFYTVFALSATDVWATDPTPNKQVVIWGGSSWSPQSAGAIFEGVWGTSDTDMWGVGGTQAGHWNGSSWSLEAPAGPAVGLFGISGAGGHIYAVGDNALILHRD